MLWKVCFPDKEIQRISKEWKQLGFQGTDPATDFRGSGIFGLQNLVYFGQRYPNTFLNLITGEFINSNSVFLLQEPFVNDYNFVVETPKDEMQDNFPVAITGLNITMLLHEILGWGMKSKIQKPSPALFPLIEMLLNESEDFLVIEQVFQELYCMVFVIFAVEWKRLKASYMDFPRVIELTKKNTEKLIESKPSLQTIKNQNQRANELLIKK